MPSLPFPRNQCYWYLKRFAKCVELVVKSAAERVLVFERISMTFNKKGFAARNHTAAQSAMLFVVGIFINFSGKSREYELNLR